MSRTVVHRPPSEFPDLSPEAISPATLALVQAVASPGHFAIDVGCGTGRFTAAIAPHLAHVIGIDRDVDAVHRAQAASRERGLEQVTFFVADAEQDDYREFLTSEPYDLVTAHLCFSPLVVERSFEALRGGGRFVLALPEIQQWQETGRRPRHAWDEDGALNVLRDRGFTVEYAGIETEIAAHGSPQEMLAAWVESPARPSWLDADRVQGLREYAVRGGTRLTVRSHLIVRARKPRNAGGAPLRDGGAPV